jgi:hypothetical protein
MNDDTPLGPSEIRPDVNIRHKQVLAAFGKLTSVLDENRTSEVRELRGRLEDQGTEIATIKGEMEALRGEVRYMGAAVEKLGVGVDSLVKFHENESIRADERRAKAAEERKAELEAMERTRSRIGSVRDLLAIFFTVGGGIVGYLLSGHH